MIMLHLQLYRYRGMFGDAIKWCASIDRLPKTALWIGLLRPVVLTLPNAGA